MILRYVNSGDIPFLNIVIGSSYGFTSFALNDMYNFIRIQSGNPGSPFVPPTAIPMTGEFKDWYYRWKVHMVELSCTVQNTSANSLYIGMYGDAISTTMTSPTAAWDVQMRILKTNKFSQYKMVGPVTSGNMSRCTLKMRIPLAKFLGNPDYRTDSDWEGGGNLSWNVSPIKVVPFFILALTTEGNTVPSTFALPCTITANIYCQMFGREQEPS